MTPDDISIRLYDADADASALWVLKRDFELSLGSGTGGNDKAAAYEAKLTERYRTRWLAWVRRCVDEELGCVVVADTGSTSESEAGSLVGYAFLLPESLAFVWDAAVLNEIYVVPDGRGTGVADALLDAVVSHAREQDLPLDRLVLDVDPENERAQAFYHRHGFEAWGEMVAREL